MAAMSDTMIYMTPTIRRAFFKAIGLAVYASLPWIKEQSLYREIGDFSVMANAAFAFSLSIVLVFLLNRAYDRWWEGRKLLGTLVNISRNLVIKIYASKALSDDDKSQILKLVHAFPVALKNHLLPDDTKIKMGHHEPNRIISEIYGVLAKARNESRLSEVYFLQIDGDLRQFLDVCGGCERIRNTRLPRTSRAMSFYLVWSYLLFLPWGIVDAAPDFVFGGTLGISFLVLAVYENAMGIADPFTGEYDALDLDKTRFAIETPTLETASPTH